MAKDFWFPFYVQKFYEGTRTMLPEERACYIDLLMYQHQHGIIPLELKRVLMYCSGVDQATLEATLEAKFVKTTEGYYNTKLREVIAQTEKNKNASSNAGKFGVFMKKAKALVEPENWEKFKTYIYTEVGKDEIVKSLITSTTQQGDAEATLEGLLKQRIYIFRCSYLFNSNNNEVGVGETETEQPIQLPRYIDQVSPVPKHKNEAIKTFDRNTLWFESLKMCCKPITLDENQIVNLMDEFITFCNATGKHEQRPEQEIKKHFTNWLKKKHQNGELKPKPKQQYKKFNFE